MGFPEDLLFRGNSKHTTPIRELVSAPQTTIRACLTLSRACFLLGSRRKCRPRTNRARPWFIHSNNTLCPQDSWSASAKAYHVGSVDWQHSHLGAAVPLASTPSCALSAARPTGIAFGLQPVANHVKRRHLPLVPPLGVSYLSETFVGALPYLSSAWEALLNISFAPGVSTLPICWTVVCANIFDL